MVDGFPLHDGRKLTVLVIGEMPGSAVEIEFPDVWREDLIVSLLVQFTSDEILKLTPNDSTLGHPKGKPLPHRLIEGKEPQLTAQTAMITFLGLLQML